MTTTTIPADVRRDWAGSLAEAGLFEAAYAWLPDEPENASMRAYLALLGEQFALVPRLLGPAETDDEFTGLLRDAAEAAAGDAQALPRVLSRASRMEPSPMISRCLARAASPHDLAVAGQAASHAVHSGEFGMGVEAVTAAAAAAIAADYAEATMLLDYAIVGGGLPEQEAIGRFRRLLDRNGRSDVAIAVASFGQLREGQSAEQREFWKRFGDEVIPKPRVPRWVAGCGLLLVVAGIGWALYQVSGRVPPLWILIFVIGAAWQRWAPLPGMDQETSRLVRGARAAARPNQMTARDVLPYLVGCMIGMMLAMMIVARDDSMGERGFTVVALSGLVLGGVAAHLARLYVPRWVERYRQDQIEKTRQNNRFPHQCECLTMAFYTAKGRREATGHLRPHHLTGPVGTVLTCPNTGVLLIDVPARERTVRVRGYDESRAVATTPGQYL